MVNSIERGGVSMATVQLNTEEIYKLLEDVKDPEIDTVSILDLGMVARRDGFGPGRFGKNAANFSWVPGIVDYSKKCGNSP